MREVRNAGLGDEVRVPGKRVEHFGSGDVALGHVAANRAFSSGR